MKPDPFSDRAGFLAVLRDCRASIDLALRAVELGAYPGPGWRAEAKRLVAMIDKAAKETT